MLVPLVCLFISSLVFLVSSITACKHFGYFSMNRLRKKKTTSQTSWTDSGSTPSGSGLQPDVAGRTHRSRVSLASSTASTSSSTSSLKLTRIDVVLFGGEKIAVPVEKSTTFAELQYEALKRARVAIPQGREVLVRLDGRNGARAYGGDSLEGVLFSDGARAGRWTVWLEWEKAVRTYVIRHYYS